MTTRFIIAIFVLLTGNLLSQPTPQWSSSIGPNLQYYFTHFPKIKFDKAGDLIVCGSAMNGANGRDMILIKYTTGGNTVWVKNFNSVSNKDDEATDFEIDDQNNIYVTGTTKMNPNNQDIITIKFDPGGNVVWTNSFNGFANRNDRSQSISLDTSYNSYITGSTELDSSSFHSYLFLRKIDPTGNTVWTKRYGSDSLSQYLGYRIRINNSDIRVLGHYISMTSVVRKYVALKLNLSGNITLSNETAITSGISSTANFIDRNGNYYFGSPIAYKTTKVDQNGTLVWKDSISTNLPWNVSGDAVRDMIVDSLQNVYTTGIHYGTSTGADVLTVKYSGSGSVLWNKRYEYLSTATSDIGNSLCLDNTLNVYIGAQSLDTVIGSDFDYAVIKYNSGGTQLGTIRYNSPASKHDGITSIQVDKTGCIYVTGLTLDNNLETSATTQKYCSLVTGINETLLANTILTAFPNPFKSETIINIPNHHLGILHLTVFSSTGQTVYEQFYSGTTALRVNLSDLNSGLYYFTIKSTDMQYCGKLVKTE